MTSADATPTALRNYPLALRALFVVVGLIATLAYAINAWQVFGFARHVWQLPLALCFGAAVVADALSLAAVFATYLLRSAKRSVRAYAWAVFFGMTGLSIAAAESFAAWRNLPDVTKTAGGGTGQAAQVAAGAIVVALALAVHLLIVVRRHVAPDPAPAPPSPARSGAPSPMVKTAPPAGFPVPGVRVPAGPAQRAVPGRKTPDPRSDRRVLAAKRVIDRGEDTAKVAADLNCSVRAVQLWVKAETERRAAGDRSGPVGLRTVSDAATGMGERAGPREIAEGGDGPSDAPVSKEYASLDLAKLH